MPPTITVALDPALAPRRNAVVWVLTECLVALGYAWREVHTSQAADLYYGVPGTPASARVVIEAHAWCPTSSELAAPTLRYARVEQGWRIAADVPQMLFAAMTGATEAAWPRGRHGFVQVPADAQRMLRKAVASRLVMALGDALRAAGAPPGMPRWPHGAAAAAAVSHDVDYPDVVRVLEPLRVVARQRLSGVRAAWDVFTGRRHHWHFDTWLDLERELGIRSAFYFVPRRGSLLHYAFVRPDPFYALDSGRIAGVIRGMVDGGWEVGLHASYEAWQSAEMLTRERRAVEAVSERPVAGLRHHYWHLDEAMPHRTLQAHADAGFLYDASVAHNGAMGFRHGLAWPYHPWNPDVQRRIGTIQLPTSWMEEHSFRHWSGDPHEAVSALDEVVDSVVTVGGCLLLDAHEYMVDERLFPGRFVRVRELMTSLARDGRFWMATPSAVALHWRERRLSCMAASSGLEPS